MSFWGPLRISRIDVDVISSINIPPGDPKSDPDARLGRLGIQAIFLVSAHLPSFAISRLFLSSGEENVGMSHHPTLRIIYNHQKGVFQSANSWCDIIPQSAKTVHYHPLILLPWLCATRIVGKFPV